jgi:hypothetical protein
MSKADQQRDERLAAALRDNLKRRKTQAREAEPRGSKDSDETPPPAGR